MQNLAKLGFLLVLAALILASCNGPEELTPEEKKKRAFIRKNNAEIEANIQKEKYEEALKLAQSASKRYPEEASLFKKTAEVAQQKYKWESKPKKEIKAEAYLIALENAVSYYKKLRPAKKEEKPSKAQEKALVFLGTIIQETFTHIPIKEYKDGLDIISDINQLLEEDTTRQAKYVLGCYYLYSYRLRKAKKFLRDSAQMEADELLNLISQIEAHEPTSEVGKKLVFRKKIRRGEAAAFYKYEMEGLSLKEENRVPDEKYIPGQTNVQDIQNYWARTEIEYCLKLGVMNLLGAKRFFPHIAMERLELAILITNTLIVSKGSPTIKQKYIAEPNPFRDSINKFIKEDNIPFAICAVREGYMTMGSDKMFNPKNPVKGLLLMKVLDKLKKEIKKNGK